MARGSRIATWVVASVLVSAAGLQGAPIAPGVDDLQDLINLGSTGVTVGDKQFYDFTYKATFSGATPAPTASQIAVSTPPGANLGIEFSFGWAAVNGSMMDSLIGYKVRVLDPNQEIDKIGLLFNGFALGSALANVVETVQTINGDFLGQLAVYTDPDGTTGPNVADPTDLLDLTPNQRELIIRKDILVFAAGSGGNASISFVDNTFVQIPEPSIVGLALAGIPLLLIRRRKAD